GLQDAQLHGACAVLFDLRPRGAVQALDGAAAEVVADRLAGAILERQNDRAGICGIDRGLQADAVYGTAPVNGRTAQDETGVGCQDCSHLVSFFRVARGSCTTRALLRLESPVRWPVCDPRTNCSWFLATYWTHPSSRAAFSCCFTSSQIASSSSSDAA